MSMETKKEMLELGEQRVEKLKARGFEHAGIYNPQGVGGTHVMYVLHHANQPELYAGLIYHYIGIGPNKETDDDEEDHHE